MIIIIIIMIIIIIIIIPTSSGVKQGCPAAMLLFILAFDPLLRFINANISPLSSSLYAY